MKSVRIAPRCLSLQPPSPKMPLGLADLETGLTSQCKGTCPLGQASSGFYHVVHNV
jgi:hypothetical protein